VANIKGNRWGSNTAAIISPDGLKAMTKDHLNIFAVEPFPIATVAGEPYTRKDDFLGTILFYFEVTQTASDNPWVIFWIIGHGNLSKTSVLMSHLSKKCNLLGCFFTTCQNDIAPKTLNFTHTWTAELFNSRNNNTVKILCKCVYLANKT
jgi:hypothetical protein